MDNRKVAALIGVVAFLFSAFLPLVSAIVSLGLIDFYGLQSGIQKTLFGGAWTMPNELAGVFLTMILYPVTLLLGFLTVWKSKRILALVTGSVGIACWLSAFIAVTNFKITYSPSQFRALIQYGSGIFLGLLGATIILISSFLRPREYAVGKRESIGVPPPPLPPPPSSPKHCCTFCGAELSEQDVFCRKCGKVVPTS